MERFDFEKWKMNPHTKLVTRDGRSARIICCDRENSCGDDGIVALVRDGSGTEQPYTFRYDGRYYKSRECSLDLFFNTGKKSKWCFLVSSRDGIISLYRDSFDTKDEAVMMMKTIEETGESKCLGLTEIECE